MKQTTIIAIILGVLVLISVVQAYQLSELKTKIADEQLTVSSATSTPTVSSGDSTRKTANLPSSIKNLPQMVGGC